MEKNARIRPPSVAGAFYPNDRDTLLNEVHACLSAAEGEGEPEKVMGAVSPHAGYMYSGRVAGALFGSIAVPDKVIIIGPNHRGIGASAALDNSDGWLFPFGIVPVDREMYSLLIRNSSALESDSAAHAWEHSLEVIVPFLYARNPNISIAAICMGAGDPETIADVANSMAKTAGQCGALLVASTDMTHYKPDEAVRKADAATVEVIKMMDEAAIMRRVISAGALCGGSSVAATIAACKLLGAKEVRLVKYGTSGDISAERSSVVGYGGFAIPFQDSSLYSGRA